MNDDFHTLPEIFRYCLNKTCWHVSVGGCTLPSFSLAIGDKIKRKKALKNTAQPAKFRAYTPEISIFIWCAWRLDSSNLVIATNDGDESAITRELKRIRDKSIVSIDVNPPAADLVIQFQNDLRLMVFCNRMRTTPILERNWQAQFGQTRILAGPGSRLEIKNLSKGTL